MKIRNGTVISHCLTHTERVDAAPAWHFRITMHGFCQPASWRGGLVATSWPEKYYSCSHTGSHLLGTMSVGPALIFVYSSEVEVSSYTEKQGLGPALPRNLG